jgi:hypothetical protein
MARFSERDIEHKMRVLISSTTCSETFHVLRRTERDMFKNIQWSSRKVPVILVRFLWNRSFSTVFRNMTKYQILWTSDQWELSLSIWKTDGRIDMTKLIYSFRNFANAPKSIVWYAAYISHMSWYWELGEKHWQDFRIRSSFIRNLVEGSKNYIRICKVSLLTVIVLYNPNAKFVWKKKSSFNHMIIAINWRVNV